jgi:hypothetical protein
VSVTQVQPAGVKEDHRDDPASVPVAVPGRDMLVVMEVSRRTQERPPARTRDQMRSVKCFAMPVSDCSPNQRVASRRIRSPAHGR